MSDRRDGTADDDARADTTFRTVAHLDGGRGVLEIHGDVDATNCDRLQHLVTMMLDDAPAALRMDLAGVTFMDSSGLRALLHAHELGRARRAEVLVANPSTAVRRVLAWTGLDTVLTIVESEDPAAR